MNNNVFCFILLITIWPLSIAAALLIQLMYGRKKGDTSKLLMLVCILFAVGYPSLLALNMCCDSLWPYQLTEPSPTGEYTLVQRYTDFLCTGYRGRTYLVVDGRYYKVDDIGPGGAYWLTDDSFSVGYSFGEEHYGGTYTVSDFVP